jgi:hypothetical protein
VKSGGVVAKLLVNFGSVITWRQALRAGAQSSLQIILFLSGLLPVSGCAAVIACFVAGACELETSLSMYLRALLDLPEDCH